MDSQKPVVCAKMSQIKYYKNRHQVFKLIKLILHKIECAENNEHQRYITIDGIEDICLLILINLNHLHAEKRLLKCVHIKHQEGKDELIKAVARGYSDHWKNRLKQFIKNTYCINVILERRLLMLTNRAAIKIQRVWRAYAYNPDKSTFGVCIAQREYEACHALNVKEHA